MNESNDFILGATVWFVWNGEPWSGVVRQIQSTVWLDDDDEMQIQHFYKMQFNVLHYPVSAQRGQDEVFATKDALLENVRGLKGE